MTVMQNSRYLFWIIRELTDKYTKYFIGGFLIGFLTLAVGVKIIKISPKQLFGTNRRVGVVGEYVVSTLPDFILQDISIGLTTLRDDGWVDPQLASSWEATNSGKTYIFHLKEGLVWHDNKPVTSKDINYNINNVSIDDPNDFAIVFTIDMEYSPFPVVVSKPVFKKGLIGIGPYKVTSIKEKGGVLTAITVTPLNTSLPRKTYIFYKTQEQAIFAYKLGEIDEIHDILTKPEEFSTWNNTQIVSKSDTKQIMTLFFNTAQDLLKEKAFRQALAYAIPEQPYERAYSPVSKTSWAYEDTVKKYDYDIKQAKKLFDQTKIGTASATLTIHTFTPYLDVANTIAASWTELGVRTDVKIENTLPADYQVLLTTRDIPNDPDQYAFWHSTQKQTNISGYSNPKIDKLLEDGRVELDQEKRKQLYTDFQKRLVDDAPAVFLYYPNVYSIIRK